jgi:broad specificity phosphatase PhoE
VGYNVLLQVHAIYLCIRCGHVCLACFTRAVSCQAYDSTLTPSHARDLREQVRHAESTENVKIGEIMAGWDRLVSLQGLPSKQELWSGVRLLECNTDSSLSDLGKQQLEEQRARMAEAHFFETENIELVVHSPLQRARDTCHALFGELMSDKPGSGVPVVVHEDLRECRPIEHVVKRCVRLATLAPRQHHVT